MKIEDICELTSGQVLSRVTCKENGVEKRFALLPKAICKGNIKTDELEEYKMKSKLDEKKLTMLGDIIIKLSTPYEAVVITEEYVGLLVPSFCAILRCKTKEFDPYYIAAFINSKSFAIQIEEKITGNSVGILSLSSLKDICIPDLSLYYQNEVAKEFIKMKKNIILFEEFINLEQEKIDTLINGENYEE